MSAGPFYAGIGSRETPANIRALFGELAYELGDMGYTLRSGAAEGADAAFERGLANHHEKEIWLPWKGFNNHPSAFYRPTADALQLAASLHPAWERCAQGARKLHARNMHQILGQDLSTPVDFVACWTKEGSGAGGTGQAIRLAKSRGIAVFDFGFGPGMLAEFRDCLRDLQRERGRRP